MKAINYFTLASLALALAACGSDNEPATAGDGRVALQVTSDIQSRAYNNTWEGGDAIGIYMLNGETVEAENCLYTTQEGGENGTFTADNANTIYFPVTGDARDFVAYYPHKETIANGIYQVDVLTQTSQKAIDLMAASRVTGKTKTDPNVTFEFSHKLVKLELQIKPDGTSLTAEEMKGLKVEITNQSALATFDVVSGSNVSVAATAEPKDITLLTAADGTAAEGIVLPNESTVGMLLRFTLPGIDGSFTWEINSADKSQSYAAGKKYLYNITVSKTALKVTSIVKDWTLGNGESGEEGTAD